MIKFTIVSWRSQFISTVLVWCKQGPQLWLVAMVLEVSFSSINPALSSFSLISLLSLQSICWRSRSVCHVEFSVVWCLLISLLWFYLIPSLVLCISCALIVGCGGLARSGFLSMWQGCFTGGIAPFHLEIWYLAVTLHNVGSHGRSTPRPLTHWVMPYGAVLLPLGHLHLLAGKHV